MPNTNTNTSVRDIMHYESKIWESADLLLAAAVKQSDFPAYMMPFFALVMLEGRMLNAVKQIEKEYGFTAAEDSESFKQAFLGMECGFNHHIVMEGKTLKNICGNDTTFDRDFDNYLRAFDPTLKKLLGVERGPKEDKFLNMDGIAASLRNKKILLGFASVWSQIDLSEYDNSAITTLEEHIKRKWADISASTAGEQYTPDDIISLIAEIAAKIVKKPKEKFLHIYDPTCGGANLLFGVADRLTQEAGYRNVATYGSEYNDTLYALSAIESRFRSHSKIHYGNTLTTVPFEENSFDLVVANPPYGTKWSGYEREIKADQKGQFPGGLPAVSDGQLLFMQHILWKLHDEGIAIEVHNGSTLFSGNAGGGESNIRKYIFDHDWVEAIIQMPQDEFFNTGIYTYLWIMNKGKHRDPKRRCKVALIDGSGLWRQLKKSKGSKRKEMTAEQRQQIVEALVSFEPSSICKIYDREHFYYNMQSLTLAEVDRDGRSVVSTLCPDGKPVKVEADAYRLDEEQNTIVRTADGEAMGCGKFTTKDRKNRKTGETITDTFIEPIYYSDYEIIPHHIDAQENKAETEAFMQRYVFKPYMLTKNVVGVELNFNREFYVPEQLEDAEDILKEIEDLENQIGEIKL